MHSHPQGHIHTCSGEAQLCQAPSCPHSSAGHPPAPTALPGTLLPLQCEPCYPAPSPALAHCSWSPVRPQGDSPTQPHQCHPAPQGEAAHTDKQTHRQTDRHTHTDTPQLLGTSLTSSTRNLQHRDPELMCYHKSWDKHCPEDAWSLACHAETNPHATTSPHFSLSSLPAVPETSPILEAPDSASSHHLLPQCLHRPAWWSPCSGLSCAPRGEASPSPQSLQLS